MAKKWQNVAQEFDSYNQLTLSEELGKVKVLKGVNELRSKI